MRSVFTRANLYACSLSLIAAKRVQQPMSDELYTTQPRGSAPNMDATLLTNIQVSRRDRDARAHFLERIEGNGPPGRIKLDRPEMSIGRGEESDLTIPTPRASRRHAILTRH